MAAILTQDALAAALVAQFASAIQAGLGEEVVVTDAPVEAGPGVAVAITVGGALDGRLDAWVSQDGSRGIARKLLGMEDEPDASVLGDLLKEMWAQAIGVVTTNSAFADVTVTGAAAEPTTGDGGSGWLLSVGGETLAQVAIGGVLATGVAALPGTSDSPAQAPAMGGHAAVDRDENLAVLMDIDLPLVVRFARTDLTLKALTELGAGSIVDMGRSPEDPVQVMVGGQVVAQGEVVVVSGNYGVRITSVLSSADRLKGLEA